LRIAAARAYAGQGAALKHGMLLLPGTSRLQTGG
jgi:hypothetical protein